MKTETYVLFQVSLIEIYNETIQDLLSKDAKTLDLKTAGLFQSSKWKFSLLVRIEFLDFIFI
jgi:hypothetical protein